MRVARRSEFSGWMPSAPVPPALLKSTLHPVKSDEPARGEGRSLFARLAALRDGSAARAPFRLNPAGLAATVVLHLLLGGFLFFQLQAVKRAPGEPTLVMVRMTEEIVRPREVLLPAPNIEAPPPDLVPLAVPDIQTASTAITVPAAAPPPVAPAAPAAPAQNVLDTYLSKVFRHLNRYKRYPAALQSKGEQGVVLLSFTIDGAGRILDFHVERTSGSAALDAQALDMIARASPIPAPPPDFTPRKLVLPVKFDLHT